MKDKSKVVMWICFTLLIGAGVKYIPPYLLEQRRLDLQERALDLREEAFIRQQVAPTVSAPVPTGVQSRTAQLL
jgi:hypothetical protein